MSSPDTARGAHVSSRDRFRRAVVDLGSLQKTPKGASIYSRYVNRPVGRRLAAAAFAANLTANQVTLLSGLFSFAAISLLLAAGPTAAVGVAVSSLLLVGYALDSADGQLARLRGAGGRAGEWFDHVLDCAVKLGLHGAVLIAWYSSGRSPRDLLLALAFQFVAVLLFFGGTLADKLRGRRAEVEQGPSHGRALGNVGQALRLLVDHATVCCVFLLWGWPDVFAVFYATLFAAHVAFLVAFGTHWFHELS